jgi:hypothetical protein
MLPVAAKPPCDADADTVTVTCADTELFNIRMYVVVWVGVTTWEVLPET